jgi:hypothetical protein
MYGNGDTAGRVAINKIALTTNQACCNLVIDSARADTSVIRDDLIILGTVSRWKRAKGLDYSEEQNEYDRILTEYINRNGTKQDLNLTQTGDTYSPVVIVPAGSWMQ